MIAHRIAYLIAEKKVPSWNIAVTFTNKAADEMRQRVQRLLHRNAMICRSSRRFTVSAFASCDRTSKSSTTNTHAASIYDQDDSIRLIKQAIRDLGYDEKYLARANQPSAQLRIAARIRLRRAR